MDEEDNAVPASSLSSNWVSLLLQLRTQSSQQMAKIKSVMSEKSNVVASQELKIKRLEATVADLIHEKNLNHLARQQSVSDYSMTDSSADYRQGETSDFAMETHQEPVSDTEQQSQSIRYNTL